jgi:hypothetical protein
MDFKHLKIIHIHLYNLIIKESYKTENNIEILKMNSE